jgi:hypothetical protein
VGYRLGLGGFGPFWGVIKGGVSAFFCRKGRGYPFFSQEQEIIDILGDFGHFVAQKVPNYSKIVQNGLLGSF